MRLDFNETNMLVRAIEDLEEKQKRVITKVRLIESLYALGVHTDKKRSVLRVSVKSLITKLEALSDDDVNEILADHKNNKIIASVCYEYPANRRNTFYIE